MPSPDEPFVYQPPDWLQREDDLLAPYAMHTRDSKGRVHPETPHPYRTLYQRDRDRIVHSTAFRRLMYKTQVLVNQVTDHHRTRLTHTLEVAQISRTIARQLGLNEDLTEAIALMHDLGHPPFGHSGEECLARCMQGHGGFEHNRHGLRIVEQLEYRYAGFPGLNLTFEVRQAQAQHSKERADPAVVPYLVDGQPLLEAQLVDAADSLAYNTHDIDDALSVGLITFDDLKDVEFWHRAVERSRAKYPRLPPLQFQPTVVRDLIDWQVCDLLDNSRRNLAQAKIQSTADVRRAKQLIIQPGPEVVRLKQELETFLRERVYRHYRVMRMAYKGQRILEAVFDELCRRPEQLPTRYFARLDAGVGCAALHPPYAYYAYAATPHAATPKERVVCDYLAGMTDRYAQDEFLRLFQPYTPV